MVRLTETELVVGRVRLPLSEFDLRSMRSSGPGGQHANKTETRIEATFDVARSTALGPRQKQRVIDKVGPRPTSVSQDSRSQSQNRDLALRRLGEKIERGLRVERRRVASKPSKAARERRLKSKSTRAGVKSLRRKPSAED